MTKLVCSDAELAAMVAAKIIPPDMVDQIRETPATTTNAAQPVSSGAARGISSKSNTTELMAEAEKALERAKESYLREQKLPPAKAPEVSREMLLSQVASLRSRDGDGGPRQALLGTMPEHSIESVENLKRITISSLMMRTRHKGKYLLCRIISSPARAVRAVFVIEDPEGRASKVSVAYYPFTLDVPLFYLDVMFPLGGVLAIREPKCIFDPDNNTPLIQVDSPSDTVFLDVQSPHSANVSWSTNSVSQIPPAATSLVWKNRGNDCFKKKEWLAASMAYSEGLKLEPDNHLLLLNRAAANLELHWYKSVIEDTKIVSAMKLDDSSESLKLKTVLRLIKAYYWSQNYAEVIQTAKLFPSNQDVQGYATKATIRTRERDTGKYDWPSLYRASRDPVFRPDAAHHRGPIQVKSFDGRMGVFTTRKVDQGEILLVATPIASSFPRDPPKGRELFLSHNFLTDETGKKSTYSLVAEVVTRVWDDPDLARILHAIDAGSRFPSTAPYPGIHAPSRPMSHPHMPASDIDIARIEGICSLNAFELEDVGTPFNPETLRQPQTPIRDKPLAVYEIPSFCNHSCVPTASKVFFGTLMMVRANKEMRQGEEVTFNFCPVTDSYEERTAFVERKWGVPCICALCKADRTDTPESRALRADILKKPAAENVTEAKKRIADLKNSYASSPERSACGIKPELFLEYFLLGILYRKLAKTGHASVAREHELRAAEAFLDALDAMGMVIRDRSIFGPSRVPMGPDITRLPVDVASPILHPRLCVAAMVYLISVFCVFDANDRIFSWMAAAGWVETQYAGTVVGTQGCHFLASKYGKMVEEIYGAFFY
ncbi:hypothetical protein BXZ70DRAFT_669780 [Cristinia sonorae]|uniref:SET domain-containing protein n=1 Tax=Cristinia sonorae TaxID=1940300 RepID=A0A8K0UUP7_9AGAR|nr:hypothetical protein BXZ70DRAFT_669780 [Cristinia sonorae]